MSLTSFDLGGGGNSFQFDSPGDSVTGKITVIEEQQQTDMQTGQPAFWENGQPKMMIHVELQTEVRDAADPADDGKRSVYLRGSKKPESQSSMAAAIAAVQNSTGARTLQVGGTFTLTLTGEGVPKQRGYNAPKLYTATYVAPSVDLGAGEQAAPAAAPPAAPQQQAAPQAPAPQQAPPTPKQPSAEELAAFQQWQQQNQQGG